MEAFAELSVDTGEQHRTARAGDNGMVNSGGNRVVSPTLSLGEASNVSNLNSVDFSHEGETDRRRNSTNDRQTKRKEEDVARNRDDGMDSDDDDCGVLLFETAGPVPLSSEPAERTAPAPVASQDISPESSAARFKTIIPLSRATVSTPLRMAPQPRPVRLPEQHKLSSSEASRPRSSTPLRFEHPQLSNNLSQSRADLCSIGDDRSSVGFVDYHDDAFDHRDVGIDVTMDAANGNPTVLGRLRRRVGSAVGGVGKVARQSGARIREASWRLWNSDVTRRNVPHQPIRDLLSDDVRPLHCTDMENASPRSHSKDVQYFSPRSPLGPFSSHPVPAWEADKAGGYAALRLTGALCAVTALTAASAAVPITIVTSMATDLAGVSTTGDDDVEEETTNASVSASAFASRAASFAVLGTALGKFVNGPMGDMLGARRVSCTYSLALAFSLFFLSFCRHQTTAMWLCACVEFFVSVQWPCVLIILSAHFQARQGSGQGLAEAEDTTYYEEGVYVASLASRLGSLLAIPFSANLLNHFGDSTSGWRLVIRFGAMAALAAYFVMQKYVSDSPHKRHHPRNPIRHPEGSDSVETTFPPSPHERPVAVILYVFDRLVSVARLVISVATVNLIPSLRAVLFSGAFWIVAFAHAGGSMVRTSDRILGTYYQNTSFLAMADNRASGLTVFLSLGVLSGLAVGGAAFARMSQDPRGRKRMVSRLYVITITMIYVLALLAIPVIRRAVALAGVLTLLQVMATFVMGAGIAVQMYHIPALVGATFGTNMGLFAAYTDGVAYGVSSYAWRVVGGAVEEGDPTGAGWAYGWAAVALLVIVCAVVMVEFMEHFFVRGQRGGVSSMASRPLPHEGTMEDSSPGHLARKAAPPSDDSPRSPSKLFGKNRIDEDLLIPQGLEFEVESGVMDASLHQGLKSAPPSRSERFAATKEMSIDELNERVGRLMDLEDNQKCVDCRRELPRWVSIVTLPTGITIPTVDGYFQRHLGCFSCPECAGSHRQLGTHIIFVRSIDLDRLKEREVRALELGGNRVVNAIFEGQLTEATVVRPGPQSDSRTRSTFSRSKYERKLWFEASAVPEKRDLLCDSTLYPSPSPHEKLNTKRSLIDEDDDDVANADDSIELVGSPLESDCNATVGQNDMLSMVGMTGRHEGTSIQDERAESSVVDVDTVLATPLRERMVGRDSGGGGGGGGGNASKFLSEYESFGFLESPAPSLPTDSAMEAKAPSGSVGRTAQGGFDPTNDLLTL